MTGFLIALISGALMSVQGVFNTQVTKTTGMWVSNAWVQLSAFALCFVMWLIMGRDSVACKKPSDNLGEGYQTAARLHYRKIKKEGLLMVYVQSQAGQPLMPTSRHGKVRRLLKEGKAKVKSCGLNL